jgi:DNA-binding beta-propeller fold protein YncE
MKDNAIAAYLAFAASVLLCDLALAEPPRLRFEHIMTIGVEGTGPGQFRYVEDLALTKTGQLLVADAAHAWVQVFDKTSGKFLARFGGKGEDDHNLDKPEGIAVDPEGNVFVADYNTGYVKKYGPDFKWLLSFSEYGSEPGHNMKSEFMDIRDGRLYLPDVGNHRISVFDLEGKFLFLFGGPGNEPGKFNTPEAAKFGPDGKLHVTDLMNDRVQVFDRDGKFLRTWGQKGSRPGDLKSPSGLAIDRHGNVFVAEIGNDRIQVFDAQGRSLAVLGSSGSGIGQFKNLHGLAVDDETDTLYVGDTGNHRVQAFRIVRERSQ